MGGQDPDRLSFRDWLDAGLVYLTRDSSPEIRAIVFELSDATTRAQVDDAADRLKITLEHERELREKYEMEQRKRTGSVKILPAGTAQRAADDFNQRILAARAAKAAREAEGVESGT